MNPHISLEYSSPSLCIKLTGNSVAKSHAQYSYSNPWSATPSHVHWEEEKFVISDAQIHELINKITNNGFYMLNSSYGADENDRHYPYYLTVNIAGLGEKSVVYRSRPDAEERPEPFREIEHFLLHQLKPS